jgi:hypothetical protein
MKLLIDLENTEVSLNEKCDFGTAGMRTAENKFELTSGRN